MSLKAFADAGGFKLLAVARLSSGAYSVMCYLLNCLAAGLEEVITSSGELAVLLGTSDKVVKAALDELLDSRMVSVTKGTGKTLVLKVAVDLSNWDKLGKAPQESGEVGLNSQDALVFPRRRRKNQLRALDGGRSLVSPPESEHSPAHPDYSQLEADRIYQTFKVQNSTPHDPVKEKNYARLLAESHPVDQVASLLEFFGEEIPSLGLLAGAWVHYLDKFHHKEHEVDHLLERRKQYESLDRKLRNQANTELKKARANGIVLSADEELVLRIFTRHPHPRKQLYWALQARERYPHLQDFFDHTADIAQPDVHTKKKNN
jgi:hypothetical protein